MLVVVFVVLVCALVTLAVGGWLIAQLKHQRSEIGHRLAVLEEPDLDPVSDKAPATAFARSGLPAPSVLNDFALPTLAGGTTTLSRWRGQRLALVFVHPECPFSRRLMPLLAPGPLMVNDDAPLPVFVSSGKREINQELFGDVRDGMTVALQDDVEVARLLRVPETPAAYLVDRHGVTEGPLLFGANAILSALGLASPGTKDQSNPAEAASDTTPLPPACADQLRSLPPGGFALDVELTDLDGQRIVLEATSERRTALVFVEPDCPACRQLAAQLVIGPSSQVGSAGVVLVSAASAEASRAFADEFALPFPIALDHGRAAALRVGTLDTPAAVLLDRGGVVAAPIAVGVAAILSLIGADYGESGGGERLLRRSKGRIRRATGANMDTASTPADDLPLVSVILTTRDRPGFLRFALTCYERQTYPNRELIVVDDGDRSPADPQLVAAAGGRLVRATPGTPIGAKLNLGLEGARGVLCQKMDDDDWYAPAYIETMVTNLLESWREACRPTVAFVTPFLFFEVARWEIRRSLDRNVPGATLFFRRADWALHPFRALPGDEDLWFFLDQTGAGAIPLVIDQPELFLAVRHRGSQRERGHTWVNQWDNRPLEDYLLERPLHTRSPEQMLPSWALSFYRELRADLLSASEARDQAPVQR
jgi:peroxiredoxin